LRIALGTEPLDAQGQPQEPFPAGINWPEVIRLSYKQKVSSLAVDGLKVSGYDPYRGLTDQKAESLKQLMDAWQNDVATAEESYDYYLMVLNTLCQIFISNGLTPIILKGYGLSLDYPIPSHRGAGDIDVFLIDKNGKPAAEQGDRIANELLGAEIERECHHSHFDFKGVLVENHYEMTDPYFDFECEKTFVERLTEMISEQPIPCPGIDGAMLPSINFNAVYLMRHIQGHFYSGSTTLRQLTDWVTFLGKHAYEVSWNIVHKEWNDCGIERFAAGINGFLASDRGLSASVCKSIGLQASNDAKTNTHITTSIFESIPYGGSLLNRCLFYWRNRWRLNFVSGLQWTYFLRRALKSYFTRHKGEVVKDMLRIRY